MPRSFTSWLVCFGVLYCAVPLLWAQQTMPFDNFRSKKVGLADSLVLDTLSIVPESIVWQFRGVLVPAGSVRVNFAAAKAWLNLRAIKQWNQQVDSLEVQYRVFPFRLLEPVGDLKKQELLKSGGVVAGQPFPLLYDLNLVTEKVDAFQWDGLQKSGSLTRGISFGNNQDASVISAFNLQLSGKLNNDVDIIASITDENVPIQPEGNTQQIQDFDRIFIQISKGSTTLIGGDYYITKPAGYFLNTYKRAQGLSFSTAFPNKNIFGKPVAGQLKMMVNGAVARGKFRRQEFNGTEGNQGPYRLTGNDGERFIIVLSGSESVYVDGQKLERGQENEYVIDYNTAEITFTARKIITKDSRIIVEFEYSDRNYQRWMIQANNEWSYKKFSYRLNFFTEFDDKNSPLQQALTEQEKQVLSSIGDTLSKATTSTVDSIGFNANEVLYKKVDSVYNGQIYTIYVYSTHPDSAIYRLSFNPVGQGRGNYRLLNTAANGRVFGWVAPLADGTPAGDYEPVAPLITPKSQRMVTLGVDYAFTPRLHFTAEGALSHYDLNTFSAGNSSDDIGYAYKMALQHKGVLKKKPQDTLMLISQISYEQVDQRFQPFVRFRGVEFERDWNFVNRNNPNQSFTSIIRGTDYLPALQLSLQQKSWGNFNYGFQAYIKGSEFSAFRNQAQLQFNAKKWNVQFSGSHTYTNDSLTYTQFVRHRTRIVKSFKKWAIGAQGEDEFNAFYNKNTDSLRLNSYMFNDWEFFITQGDSSRNAWKLFYKIRTDELPGANRLTNAAIAHHAGISLQIMELKGHQLKTTLTYRNLIVTDTNLFKQPAESSLLTRIQYNGAFAKQAIQISVFYENGSGLENRRDFQFIQSLNGLGSHVWIDYNGNGVKERDEYELRTGTIVGTDGLTYIKIIIPTVDFIKTYYNQFTASVSLKTPMDWSKKGGFKKWMSRFSSQTVYRADRKTQSDNLLASFNPFEINASDSALIGLNYSFRQSVFFNRFSSRFGAELNYQEVQNRQLLATGLDTRSNQFGNVRIRWNISKVVTVNTDAKYGVKKSDAELLRNRIFNIEYIEIQPQLVVQPSTKLRFTGTYTFGIKQNRGVAGDSLLPGGEQSIIHDGGLACKINFLQKGQLEIKTNYIRIDYNGLSNNALAFEMLNGLTTGNNVTWGVSFQRSIGGNLQLSLTYDGRKSDAVPMIHIAAVQLRAFF